MRFAADVVGPGGATYRVENSPADVVRWEAQNSKNNVEGLKRYTSIMAILHLAALRQEFTDVKGFNEWVAGLESFDLVDPAEVGPTSEGQPVA